MRALAWLLLRICGLGVWGDPASWLLTPGDVQRSIDRQQRSAACRYLLPVGSDSRSNWSRNHLSRDRILPPRQTKPLFLISALFPTCDGSRAGPALQQGLCLWRAAGYRFYCYDNRFMTRRGRHPQEPTDGIAIAVCWSFELTKALVRPEIPCQEIVLGRLL